MKRYLLRVLFDAISITLPLPSLQCVNGTRSFQVSASGVVYANTAIKSSPMVIALGFVILLLATTTSVAQQINLVSVNSSGVKSNGQSTRPDISADGRYVAFVSRASNLVANDPPGPADVFVKDLVTGQIELVSKATDGTFGNANSLAPISISANGRYVTFLSFATNLTSGAPDGFYDQFWHDRVTGETQQVNVADDGSQANSYADLAAVSGDGRYVAFRSQASNLVPGGPSSYQVYLRDTQAGTTRLISRNATGTPQGGGEPDISSDGRYVVYVRASTEVYVVDTLNCSPSACSVQRANLNNSGQSASGHSSGLLPKISGNGRYVAWESDAVGYVAGDTNGVADIFVRDLLTATTSRASIASDGTQANSFSYTPDLSDDGRFVMFTSNATNLAGSDTNGVLDIYRHDRQEGTTIRISQTSAGGQLNNHASYYSRISGNGQHVAFSSTATNAVPADTDATEDVYVFNVLPPNDAPVADAGDDLDVPVGVSVSLSGSQSSDDMTPTAALEFQWTITGRPSGSDAGLLTPNLGVTSFTPDLPGEYVVQLVVTDDDGLDSEADSVIVVAELSPAFVYERLSSGVNAWQYIWDVDSNFWAYTGSGDYFYPTDFSNGKVAGTRESYDYSYDSRTGAYAYSSDRAIGVLSSQGEQRLVSRDDPIPGTSDGRFSDFWSHARRGQDVYFWGWGNGSGGYYGGEFKVNLDSGVVASATVVPPIPVTGKDSPLQHIWNYYYSSTDPRLYMGSNGSCARTRSYTYNNQTYTYCIWHQGLYIIENGQAVEVVDNRTLVPGAGATDYFEGFGSAENSATGRTTFWAYWLNAVGNEYKQGLFRRETDGALSMILDDADPDWSRGWFGRLQLDGEDVIVGGQRYRNGYDAGRWWSAWEQGIYRVTDADVVPVVLGGGGYQGDSERVSYLYSHVDSWNFAVGTGVVAYQRYDYAYDSSLGESNYGSGLYWKEQGKNVRVHGNSGTVLGREYDWVSSPCCSGNWIDGRSLGLWAGDSEYTYEHNAAEDRYEYFGSSTLDVLLARFDTDRDGRSDDSDNCRYRPNPDQLDSDNDGIGNPCEDTDADSVQDVADNCPLTFNSNQANGDPDPFGDSCDVCPLVADDQADVDGDGSGDACDLNSDEDTFADALDNCPLVANQDQSNLDGDIFGDLCDPDADGDGIANAVDGRWDGTTHTDQQMSESVDFSDHALGGRSHGRLINRGQLIVQVEDAPETDQGLFVSVVNGTGSARLAQCDFRGRDAQLEVAQGTVAVITCGSIAVQTRARAAHLVLDGSIVITIPQLAEARVVDLGEGEIVVANDSVAPIPTQLNLGANTVVSIPGGATGQIAEPAPGQFEILNTTESRQPITAEIAGAKIVYSPGDIGVPVRINIKPSSEANTIKVGSGGVYPTAVFSSATFDATRVDPLSVTLASAPVKLTGQGKPIYSLKDIDGDGRTDILLQIETSALILNSAIAQLRGMTVDGVAIFGSDVVKVVK